jgi:hypothetical protein
VSRPQPPSTSQVGHGGASGSVASTHHGPCATVAELSVRHGRDAVEFYKAAFGRRRIGPGGDELQRVWDCVV